MKIFNIGSLNIDYVYGVEHFVRPGETLSSDSRSIFPGGKGLNQSVALAKAGVDVIHVGMVGADGDFLLSTLEGAGVNTSNIKKTDGASGHAIIQIDATGQNSIILFAGANFEFDRGFILSVLSNAAEGDIILLQNEINCLDVIFEIAHQKNLRIAFNPSPFNERVKNLPLHYVWLWLCNEIEGAEISGKAEPAEILTEFENRYPESNILLTLGKDGALYKEKGKDSVYQPIIKSNVVDTTAAGDTFTGYFLSGVINGYDAQKALLLATAASSIGVSRQGASCSIPTLCEVNDFLKKIK